MIKYLVKGVVYDTLSHVRAGSSSLFNLLLSCICSFYYKSFYLWHHPERLSRALRHYFQHLPPWPALQPSGYYLGVRQNSRRWVGWAFGGLSHFSAPGVSVLIAFLLEILSRLSLSWFCGSWECGLHPTLGLGQTCFRELPQGIWFFLYLSFYLQTSAVPSYPV